jgi:nucleotide-binding universal stress UspA family protein
LLCPIDCSDGSRAALDYALFISEHFGAKLHVLHCWHVSHHVRPDLSVWMEAHGQKPISEVVASEARQQTERFLSSLKPTQRSALEVEIVEGQPWRTIIDVATREAADLIVLGSHGHSGLAHLTLGSTAEKVVRHAKCPVLTVRHPAP